MLLKSKVTIVIRAVLGISLVMPVVIVNAQNADTASTTLAAADGQNRAFNFPRWPEQRHAYRERVPMAPPGPYMSSALSDFSFDTPRGMDRHDTRRNTFDMPMDRFSQGAPWPSRKPHNDYGYSYPQTELPGNEGQDDSAQGNDWPPEWPEHKWPDWPENSRVDSDMSANGSGDGQSSEDDWSHQKWPTSHSRPDDDWPENKWPDDNGPDNKWPDWPDSNW